MKIAWEATEWPGSQIEPAICNLSWIAHPDRPGHGMIGVGTESGSVGITYTDLYPCDDDHSRYNFNLRGHHSAIVIVTWNKGQTKLASCDTSGVIYVWVKNEDRWSVELVNDRGVKVRDLCWSPCGTSALICYEDNFVLIGSSSGQRVWSNSFPASTTVTCGCWAPDSRQLILGFLSGTIQILSEMGSNIMERSVTSDPIQRLACAASKDDRWTLAVLTTSNKILMVSSYDQVDPFVYRSAYDVTHMQWNNEGTILALITTARELVMLDRETRCIHRETLSMGSTKSLSAMTWAHDGQVIVVAAGGHLSTGRLMLGVPSLFSLVTYDLWRFMGCSSRKVDRLPLPVKEKNSLRILDHHVIRCRIPRPEDLSSFVCNVSEPRCYCTIKPLSRGSNSYVLCMEHLGGLVPLLLGRQVNRFLPQFQILLFPMSASRNQVVGSSAQVEDASLTPRASTGRNSLWRSSKRKLRALMSRHVRPSRPDHRLVQVSSNVWCTRFSISSMAATQLPEFLGQVVYKTSVLHLQPRQMTIDMAVLCGRRESARHEERRGSMCTSTAATSETDPTDDRTSLIIESRKDDGLTKEERAFFDRVVSECTSLRAAMDAGCIGVGLKTSQVSAKKETAVAMPTTSSGTSTTVTTPRICLRKGGAGDAESAMTSSTTSTWMDEIEQLEFIDGADERDQLLVPSTSTGVTAKSSSSSTKENDRKDATEDIQTHLDRLARIAGQLSHRHADFNSKRDRESINKMRAQMKELLKRVNDIEKKVGSGDVRVEVRQLMRTLEDMKKALGDSAAPPCLPSMKVVTMHNKTPFWNEHNQVYQLDFGGRVTQESAKNFQVELDNKQVLQFGRIEGGAYTLDFRRPFSACQAFAVALASITQRLK